MFKQIDAATRLSQQAFHQVLNLVENGDLKPGDRLPGERELVQQLGVSRNSIREALRMLEAVGVVKVVQGKGSFIDQASPVPSLNDIWSRWLAEHRRQVMDLLELREALEAKAVAWAAVRATPADIAQIETAHEMLRPLLRSADAEAMADADLSFHFAICSAVHNPLFLEVLTSMLGALHESRVAILGKPGRAEESFLEHAAIVGAIIRQDSGGAVEAMQSHMRSTMATVPNHDAKKLITDGGRG